MTTTSHGYAGQIQTTDYARLSRLWGARYSVVGAGSWAVTASSTVDRGVVIAPGTGYGCGIEDITDAEVTVTPAVPPASGVRYDTIVAHRDWQPGVVGDRTTFKALSGSAAQLVTRGDTEPGVEDDQPIALVAYAAGSTTATVVADLRVWHGSAGLWARSTLVLGFLDEEVGTRIVIDDVEYTRELDGSGAPVWTPRPVSRDFRRGRLAGELIAYGGTSAPAGWLLCDGQAVGRATYPDLFTAIGTAYGAGNGSTTFNLPDMRGRVAAGVLGGSPSFGALGQKSGAETVTLSVAQMPTHSHVQDAHNHAQLAHRHDVGVTDLGSGGAGALLRQQSGNPVWPGFTLDVTNNIGGLRRVIANDMTATNVATVATNQNTGGNLPHPNVQPSLAVNWLIKT